jgi:hypothetical protein
LWLHALFCFARAGKQVQQGGWAGRVHPNLTQPWDSFATVQDCGHRGNAIRSRAPSHSHGSQAEAEASGVGEEEAAVAGVVANKVGCLFNVLEDPEERDDLAEVMPGKVQELLGKMRAAEAAWFNPHRGLPDPRACQVAEATGFWGPFAPSGLGLE